MAHICAVRNGMTACDEKDLSNIAVSFVNAGGGVVGANDYLVQAQGSPNNTVLINTGKAYVPTSDGTMVYATRLDATQNVTIGANSSGNARIDSIVLYVDLSASPDAAADNVAKFFDVPGTPSGSPVAPTNAQILAAIGASNPYIILATIAVANGFTSINAGNITDGRAFAKISGGDPVFQSDFANYVHSGLTIPTSASLTTTAAAGVIYYGGNKISVASDNGHTYTASQDTYVDVSNTGTFIYSGVANGAAAPALTASSIRVAKVVTSGTAVTSVVQTGQDSLGNFIYPPSPLTGKATGFASGCSVTASAATQSIPSATWTQVAFDTKVYDLVGEFNTGTNRFVATNTGKYLVCFAGYISSIPNGYEMYVAVYKNGVFYKVANGQSGNAPDMNPNMSAIIDMVASDYLTFYVYHSYSSALNLNGGVSHTNNTYAMVQRLF